MWQTDVWCLKAMAVSMKPGFTCVKTGKEYFPTTPPPPSLQRKKGRGLTESERVERWKESQTDRDSEKGRGRESDKRDRERQKR